MPTYRRTSDGVWRNPWLQPQSPHAKLIWAYLLNNPQTENSGIFQITIKTIYDDLCGEEERPNDTLTRDEVKEILQRWVTDGHIIYQDGYIGIRDFHQHNSYLNNVKYQANIAHQLKNLPRHLANLFIKYVIPDTEIGNRLAILIPEITNPPNSNSKVNSNSNSKVDRKDNIKTETPLLTARQANAIYMEKQGYEDVSNTESWEIWVRTNDLLDMRREYGDEPLCQAMKAVNKKCVKLGGQMDSPENYMKAVCKSESNKLKGVKNGK